VSAVVHSYATRLAWSGSTAPGYDSYPREHTLTAPPAEQELRLSSDQHFKGDARLLNPELLVVAAASSCQLLEFLALAAKARIDVLEYGDEAEGTMDESDEPARIQRIVLRPRIVVAAGPSEDRVRRLVHLAHDHCYVANSLRTEIEIEAEIEVRG
jgi:organic hydroperoxide reductase OsmC/OhrA